MLYVNYISIKLEQKEVIQREKTQDRSSGGKLKITINMVWKEVQTICPWNKKQKQSIKSMHILKL